jgi:hypothetical protein
LLQFYRDLGHVDEVRGKIMMMQDESVGEFMKGFDNLVTQGKNLIRSIYSATLGLEVLSI